MLQNSMCVSKPKIVILHLCNRFWATFLKCALLCCNLQFEDYRPLLLYCKIVNLEKKLRKNFSFFRKFSRLYIRQLYGVRVFYSLTLQLFEKAQRVEHILVPFKCLLLFQKESHIFLQGDEKKWILKESKSLV